MIKTALLSNNGGKTYVYINVHFTIFYHFEAYSSVALSTCVNFLIKVLFTFWRVHFSLAFLLKGGQKNRDTFII